MKNNIPYFQHVAMENADPCYTWSPVKSYCPVNQQGNHVSVNNDFHIYSGEWFGDYVKLYIDGQYILTDPNFLSQHFDDKMMNLILDVFITHIDNSDANGLVTGNVPNATGTNPNGGNNNGRDFIIDYARVWSNYDHVFDYYFKDDEGYTYTTDQLCPNTEYHLLTAWYPGTNYHWAWSSGITPFNQGAYYDPNAVNSGHGYDEIFFKVLSAGTPSITLTADNSTIFTNTSGNPNPHVRVYNFNVSVPSAPSVSYEQIGSTCDFQFCVTAPLGSQYTYSWSTNGSTYGSGSSNQCYTGSGYSGGDSYSIWVKATNCTGSSTATHISGTLPYISPEQPDVFHERIGHSCEYKFCVYPIPNATGYKWSFNGGSSYGSLETDECSSNTVLEGTYYNIRVKSVNDCGESAPTSSIGTLPDISNCMARLESDSSAIDKQHSFKIYPSPSSGYLWIENNSNENTIVFLKTISGELISKFALEAKEKKQLINLAEGLLLVEIFKQNDFSIIQRSLVPVINTH